MANRGVVEDTYTLVVPTYNRPAELGRLLRYLARHRVAFRILVLDSSEPEIQRANRSAAGAVDANIDFESFDPSTLPWDKFRRGSELVRSPYCSLCADDDVVLPDSLEPIVEFLSNNPDHSVAHGWYFSFHNGARIGITASAYSGASLDHDDPLQRLYALFRNYEAVTYGVYSTAILRTALREVQGVQSMLAKELLAGALSVVRGKSRRLPIFYYGRSHTPSHPYTRWHPLDFLASSPDGLYRDYAAYRALLLECFEAERYTAYSRDELIVLIDLVHFRYLADYVRPGPVDYLVQQVMARSDKAAIMQGLWPVLAAGDHAPLPQPPHVKSVLRRLRDRYLPGIGLQGLRRLRTPPPQRSLRSTTPSGQQREYLLYRDFLDSVGAHAGLTAQIPTILSALDRYE